MPILKTVTLGCKVNQYETEYVRQGLAGLGYHEACSAERPQLCVVNTCTVTAEAEARGRKLIRLLARKYPQAEIVVMGCAAARAPEEAQALPGVVEVLADKAQLPQWLANRGLSQPPDGICGFSCRRRAYVKVQDGCRMRCAYCIVPRVRPVLRSRPPEQVLAEVARLLENGHREIVLTGIHLGHYGAEKGTSPFPHLADLVEQLVQLPGDFRVRLSSIEASEVRARLVRLMRDHPERLCPHFHLPLQSGSNAVLARMGRPWSVERFARRCEQIRDMLDRPSITSDIIVGFPGESEEDFRASCRAVREIGFARVHVFRYSRRQGTPAAQMPGQVRDGLKQERAAELEKIARQSGRSYLESLMGRPLSVLVESPVADRPGWMQGTADRYVPVRLPGTRELIGRMITVVGARVRDEIIEVEM
jgi:threonylcarbamoyladenosine tRNA methylthiotransferase MtaB